MNLSHLKTCKPYRFVWRFFLLWQKNQINLRAAALTYTLILGLIPAIAVSLAILSVYFYDISQLKQELKLFLLKSLATGTGTAVTNAIDLFLSKVRFRTIGLVGMSALLLTSIFLISALENSVNMIWHVQKQRVFWRRVALYLLFLILGPLAAAISLLGSTYVTKFSKGIWLPANIGTIAITAILFFALFKTLPNARVKNSWAALSALLTAAALETAKWGYAIYTAKALFYNKVYGSLAALPLFLIWIYLNWTIFLSGTQLNYMLQYPTEEQKP